jgi:hypothetical protein
MILFRLRIATIIYTQASEEGCKVMEATERCASAASDPVQPLSQFTTDATLTRVRCKRLLN